jgi:hypothetical protein
MDGLSSFTQQLRINKESARIAIEQSILDLDEKIQDFQARWESSSTSKEVLNMDEELSGIDMFLNECDDLVNSKKDLLKNCTILNVKFTDSSSLEHIYEDIMRHVDGNEANKEFCNEEAILFNRNWKGFDLKDLVNFSSQWKSRVEKFDNAVFAKKILKKIKTIHEILPALKYCCGDDYKEEHWAELFYDIIGVSRDISLNDMTCHELIQANNKLLLPQTVTLLQQLQSRYVFPFLAMNSLVCVKLYNLTDSIGYIHVELNFVFI